MTTRYTATDSLGRVHKRGTEHRTYTHAVVVDHGAFERDDGRGWPASTSVQWAGRRDLAEAYASRWHKARVERAAHPEHSQILRVEIVPAVEVVR